MPAEQPVGPLQRDAQPDDHTADKTLRTTTVDDRTHPAKHMLVDLYELIAALDRRVPRLERIGEMKIAQDAADLRERAVRLIREIEDSTQMP
jgi:hypothetical protein